MTLPVSTAPAAQLDRTDLADPAAGVQQNATFAAVRLSCFRPRRSGVNAAAARTKQEPMSVASASGATLPGGGNDLKVNKVEIESTRWRWHVAENKPPTVPLRKKPGIDATTR